MTQDRTISLSTIFLYSSRPPSMLHTFPCKNYISPSEKIDKFIDQKLHH
jgi:hypothetical protein